MKLPVPSGIYKYGRIVNGTSSYAKKMNRLSNSIFNEVKKPTDEYSKTMVDRFAKDPLYQNYVVNYYYPRLVETNKLMKVLRDHGLYRDEHQDFWEEMERLREARGKGKAKFFSKNMSPTAT